MSRAPWGVRSVLLGVLLAAAIAVAAGLAMAVADAAAGNGDVGDRPLTTIAHFAARQAALVIAVLLLTTMHHSGGLRLLGIASAKGRAPYLVAFLAWVAALLLAAAWGALVTRTGPEILRPPDTADQLGAISSVNVLLLLLLLAVWVPITEELFFRGFVLRGIAARYGPRLAIVISAAIFALFHLSPPVLVPTFIIGVALGWIFIRTDSIWPSIMAHGIHNGVVVLIVTSGQPAPSI